jgi:SAM-dependent methyltransferase
LSSVETEAIRQEFDGDACDFCDRYKTKGLSRSSRLLFDFIRDSGAKGKAVLDLGSGAGGFSMELLKEGAESAVGFDLSPKMIDSAIGLASAAGFESRAKFQVGDAATSELPSADIVIMDKVLCCYSQWEPLLGNAMKASRGMVGFIVPRDEGLAKWPFRLGLRLVNFFSKRRGGVMFYLHPLGLVDRRLRESGFVRRNKQGSRFWLVFLYSRS